MLKLLRIEWNKLWPSRTFRILFAIYVSFFAFTMLVIMYSKSLRRSDVKNIIENIYNPFQFPDSIIILSLFAHWGTLLLAIITIVLVTNEFTYKTARQHVIDGLSRLEFVLLKFLDATVLTILSTICVLVFALIFGFLTVNTDTGATLGQSIPFIAGFVFSTLGFLTFAMFLAIWIKRTGIAILLFILLHTGMLPALLTIRMPDIARVMPVRVFRKTLVRMSDTFVDTIGKVFQGKGVENGVIDFFYIPPVSHFLLVSVYILGFIGLSYLVLKRRDLKA